MEQDFLHNSLRVSEASKFETVNLHMTSAYGPWIGYGVNYRERAYLLRDLIKGVLWERSLPCSHRHGFTSCPPSSFSLMPDGIFYFLALASPSSSEDFSQNRTEWLYLPSDYIFKEKKSVITLILVEAHWGSWRHCRSWGAGFCLCREEKEMLSCSLGIRFCFLQPTLCGAICLQPCTANAILPP